MLPYRLSCSILHADWLNMCRIIQDTKSKSDWQTTILSISVSFYLSEVVCGLASIFAIILTGISYAALKLKFLGSVMTVTIKPKENVLVFTFELVNITFWKRVCKVHRGEPWLPYRRPRECEKWLNSGDSCVYRLSWCYQCRRFLPFRSVLGLDGKLLL